MPRGRLNNSSLANSTSATAALSSVDHHSGTMQQVAVSPSPAAAAVAAAIPLHVSASHEPMAMLSDRNSGSVRLVPDIPTIPTHAQNQDLAVVLPSSPRSVKSCH